MSCHDYLVLFPLVPLYKVQKHSNYFPNVFICSLLQILVGLEKKGSILNHVLKIPNWLDDLSLIGQCHRIEITQINTGGHQFCITWNIFDYILKMKIWIVVNFFLLIVWKNCMKSSAWNILISLSTRGVAKSGKFYVVNSHAANTFFPIKACE